MRQTKVCPVGDIRATVAEEEWAARVDLAACYRLVALYGMTDLIYNHISAQVPGHDDQYLINPYGMLYEEITASSLLKIDIEGRTLLQPDHGYNVNVAGFYLHAPIHRARPDVKCVLHTHTRAGTAVSTLSEGLLPLSQTAMRFHGRIGYHDFEGPAIDRDECDRVVADLGCNNVLVLRIMACWSAAARFRRRSMPSIGWSRLAGSRSTRSAAAGHFTRRPKWRSATR